MFQLVLGVVTLLDLVDLLKQVHFLCLQLRIHAPKSFDLVLVQILLQFLDFYIQPHSYLFHFTILGVCKVLGKVGVKNPP